MSTPTSATPPARLSSAFLTLFLLATGLSTLAVAGTAPVLPMLLAHFESVPMAAILVRATLTIGSIGIVVGAPLTMWGARAFGRKPLLIGAALIFTLAGVSGYVVNDLTVIVASRFVVGVTAAFISTLTVTIVAESYDEAERNRWMGRMVGVGTFLAMVLLPLAGVLGDIGWRDCFLLNLLGAPIAMLAWFGYRPPARRAPGPLAETRRIPFRFDLIALGLCTGIAINVQTIYAPFKLDAIGVRSATLIGLSMMPFTLAAALVSPLYGRVRRWATAPLVFGLGFGALACGQTVFLLAPNLLVALCGWTVFGAAMGLVIANLYVVGSQSNDPEHRGAGLGQTLAAFYAAPLVAQVLLEPLVKGQPLRALFWLAAFCGLMCLSSLALVVRSAALAARPA